MKMRKDEVHEALNRSLSGLHENPWLAQRILASEKGEERMKKKQAKYLVPVLIALISITVVAFAATEVYKTITINQKGEIIDEQEVLMQPQPTQTPTPMIDEEFAYTREQEYLDNAPEDQYAEVTSDGSGASRGPQKTVFSESEFRALMVECDYLTQPDFVPAGYHFEMATVYLGCDEAADYQLEELKQEGNTCYACYSIPAGHERVTGYDVTYRDKEGGYISVYDTLAEYTADDEHLFSFPETYDYRGMDLPGMEYSISIAGNGWNCLIMMRKLDNPTLCRWYPERDYPNRMPDFFTYQSEEINVSSNSVDAEALTSMYGKRDISE